MSVMNTVVMALAMRLEDGFISILSRSTLKCDHAIHDHTKAIQCILIWYQFKVGG